MSSPASVNLLDPVTAVYTLGPEGTFSDEAARLFQHQPDLIRYSSTFAEALLEVRQDPLKAAVVPIENSVAGTVAQVQDALVSMDLEILAEVSLPITYSLLASADPEKIQDCYTHSQAFEQTSRWIAQNIPKVRPQFTRSNIDSGLQFLEKVELGQNPLAAIVPVSFALKHPQYLFAENIQDYKNNTTRFLLVKNRGKNQQYDFNRKKTALFVEFQEDRPGLLYRMLSVFNLFGINLCRLESRPSKSTPWMYDFYVDFYNIQESEACLDVLRTSKFNYKILGSYDVHPSAS